MSCAGRKRRPVELIAVVEEQIAGRTELSCTAVIKAQGNQRLSLRKTTYRDSLALISSWLDHWDTEEGNL